MKLNHKQKVKLARKMRTKADIKSHAPIFATERWLQRAIRIQMRVKKHIEVMKAKKYEKLHT